MGSTEKNQKVQRQLRSSRLRSDIGRHVDFRHLPEIYIQSAPNNSNESYTFMGLGRGGRFGQS